jgi:RNA polymerase sigma-70 factor (ECF subfamily)
VTSVDEAFRRHAAEALATLIRLVGDFDLAEEGLQEAFAAATLAWRDGPPANARAWLIQVARRKALDQLRRRIALRPRLETLTNDAQIKRQAPPVELDEADAAFGDDDLLRLIFTCCHPSLSLEAQVALTLRTVCSLPTPAVARAFVVSEETMAQRLVRAKAKIRAAGIPYRTPPRELLEERTGGVLAVLYLVFTESYAGDPSRSLADEAIGLARRLDALLPGRGPIKGLLALMLLHAARRPARFDAAGDIVLLEDQDRKLWNRAMIVEGLSLVEPALRAATPPSTYAVQAAIAALHAQAQRASDTDWRQIVGLYAVLMRLNPSPVIELNHAAALAMVDGPAAALQRIDALAARGTLASYNVLPAVRADLLRRLRRFGEAEEAYRAALQLARRDPDRRFFAKRLVELAPSVANSPQGSSAAAKPQRSFAGGVAGTAAPDAADQAKTD